MLEALLHRASAGMQLFSQNGAVILKFKETLLVTKYFIMLTGMESHQDEPWVRIVI